MSTVSWASDLTGESVENLEAAACRVPPGSAGLITIPDWLAPGEAPYRRGAILGLQGSTGRGHLYRSVLEGLGLTMAANILAMERALGVEHAHVTLSGGGSRSPLMRQIVAEALNRPVLTTENPDGAGLGAAICATVGADVHPSSEAAVRAMVRPGPATRPDPEVVPVYADLAVNLERARVQLDPYFASLDPLPG